MYDEWAAPPPDLSQAPVRQSFKIGPHRFKILISHIQEHVPLEPHTHLIQMQVLYGDRPLAPADLGLTQPDSSANVWAYLTNKVNEIVVQFYSPQPTETGDLNPRLGCWGPRPDLVERGLGDSEAAIAAIMGVSVWTPGSKPPVDEMTFLEALRDTLIESITYWVVVAHKTVGPVDRKN
jgi:hypothetical protein